MEAVLRGSKFTSVRMGQGEGGQKTQTRLERSHTNNVTAHLKALTQKDVTILKRKGQQKIIKLRAKINKIETKKISQ